MFRRELRDHTVSGVDSTAHGASGPGVCLRMHRLNALSESHFPAVTLHEILPDDSCKPIFENVPSPPGCPKHFISRNAAWTEALPGYGSNQNDHLPDQVRESGTFKDFPKCPLVRNII